MSLKEQLLQKVKAAPKAKQLEEVPILGEAWVRRLSGGDRDAWDLFNLSNSFDEEDQKAGKGRSGMMKPSTRHIRATLVAKMLSDEEGNRLFGDEEIPAVSDWDGELLDYLWDEGRKYNGLGKQAAEDVRKNSGAVPSDAGGSA